MKHQFLESQLFHLRLKPKTHQFNYKSLFFVADVSREENLQGKIKLSSFFSFDLNSLFGWKSRPIYSYVDSHLKKNKINQEVSRIKILSSPALFGRVFNPVSFLFCYSADNELISVIADVNNTFAEKHIYVLAPSKETTGYKASTEKDFHVSPFFPRSGKYEFNFIFQNQTIEIVIDYIEKSEKIFSSRLACKPLEESIFKWTLLAVTPWLSKVRIYFHASLLRFVKRLNFYPKPSPKNENTLRSDPFFLIDKVLLRVFLRYLRKMRSSSLQLLLPDQRQYLFGSPEAKDSAKLLVKDYRFFRACLKGDIGLGEAFERNWWTSNDPRKVLKFFISNLDQSLKEARKFRPLELFRHSLNKNTLKGSKRNISKHYDLSNEFFSLWLDSSMNYSSAYFANPEDDLESAQLNKMSRIIEAIKLEPGMKVLEIGTGWGGLSTKIAQTLPVEVTTTTISKEQFNYAQNLISNLNLGSKVNVIQSDYRELRGSFDRIVSVEMLEAVGHDNLRFFFETCDRLLNPDGKMFIQVISIPDARYETYRNSVDWIRKYIFPGGHLPSLGAIHSSLLNTKLFLEKSDDISEHYALTLQAWKKRFNFHQDQILKMGFDEAFFRRWNYYFDYCTAGFETKMIQDHQLIFRKWGTQVEK